MKALVVFASLTGNTEEIAEIMTDALEVLDVETEMLECSTVYGEDFNDADICIVATYTYGTDANLPDEIVDLYEDLDEVDLSGKVFATMGSGDHFYDKFCQAVDDFSDQLEKAGAVRGGESIKVDLNAEEEDIAAIKKCAADCVAKLNNL